MIKILKRVVKYLNKVIRVKELKERLAIYEDHAAHVGNELGAEDIVKSIREEIEKVEGNMAWWLK